MAAKSPEGKELEAARNAFTSEGGTADALGGRLGLSARAPTGDRRRSQRFAYFADDDRYAIVVGAQEKRDTELALAYGLSQCGSKKLNLVLPVEHAFATLQRAAWLREDSQPDIWLHDGKELTQVDVPTPDASRANLLDFVATRPDKVPEREFSNATTPLHLGKSSPGVAALVEWATEHPKLDGSHRQGERAWHCMGQRVLSMRGTHGLKIRAGIHWGDKQEEHLFDVVAGDDLSEVARSELKAEVERGIEARLQGHTDLRSADDEHWLQAVLRRRPEIVGVEQPALREVPAWRPSGAEPESGFQRGFIDLVGLDGLGDVRIVETKLTKRPDDLLIFQGLDYFIWSQVYEKPLRRRLGAPKGSDIVVHYVLGADANGNAHVSDYWGAQVKALRPDVLWRFQIVADWFNREDPWSTQTVHSQLLPIGSLPSEVGDT